MPGKPSDVLNPLQAATLPAQPATTLPGQRFAAKTSKPQVAEVAFGSTPTDPAATPGADTLRAYSNLQSPRFGQVYRALGMDLGDILLGDHGDNAEWDEWDKWKDVIWKAATKNRKGFEDGPSRGESKGWLNPEDTVFVIADRVKLLQAAARSGFLSRFRHWSHGEAFQSLYNQQKYGFSKIYELVAGGKPNHAFLLDENPTYAQKLVQAHVLGHTDFYRNNYRFANCGMDDIASRMGETRDVIEQYKANPLIMRRTRKEGYNPVTKFLDNYLAIEYLIDMDEPAPPPVVPYGQQGDKGIDMVDYDEIGPNTEELGIGKWMRKVLLTDDEQEDHVNELMEERERRTKDTPSQPTADVVGYIIENSKALEPWQRDTMLRLRDESYFFSNLIQTKVMNEGWASFWHNKILGMLPDSSAGEEIPEPKYMSKSAQMAAGVERPNPGSINPYWLGVNLFKHIYARLGRDIPMNAKTEDYSQAEWQRLMSEQPDETKGIKGIQNVRRHEKDTTFIRQFLTQEFIDENNMYIYDGFADYDYQTGQQVQRNVIVSRNPERVKANILKDYFNGGMPRIEVKNGNHNGKGELLLEHQHVGKDINRQDAVKTLKILQQMWGQPTHLDTLYSVEADRDELTFLLRTIYNYRQNEKRGYTYPIYYYYNWNWRSRYVNGQYQQPPIMTIDDLEKRYFDIMEGTRKVPIRLSTTDEPDAKGYKRVEIYEIDEETGDVKKDTRGNPVKFDPRKYQPERMFNDDDWW